MAREVSEAQRNRWRSEILDHLEDFPRQYAALENAMGAFGADFDLKAFKAAFESTTNMDAYNRAQAVERALGRVQNYVAQLAIAGNVHRAAELILSAAREFIGPYRAWVENYL